MDGRRGVARTNSFAVSHFVEFQAPRVVETGGSVKAEGLGDGPAHGKGAIAKLRLTLPPISCHEDLNKLGRTQLVCPWGLDWAGLVE